MKNCVIDLNKESFFSVLKSNETVAVEFFTQRCEPCKKLAPIMDEVAAELGDKIFFGKFDMSKDIETPLLFRISVAPTVCVFRNGELSRKFIGLKKKKAIIKFFEKI